MQPRRNIGTDAIAADDIRIMAAGGLGRSYRSPNRDRRWPLVKLPLHGQRPQVGRFDQTPFGTSMPRLRTHLSDVTNGGFASEAQLGVV